MKKKACRKKKKPKPIIKGEFAVGSSKLLFTSNIITTNKNKIATAPTYTIIKIRLKKSIVNRNRIQAEQQKVNIRNKTECIGLADKNTKKPQKQKISNRKKCKLNISKLKTF